MPFTLGQTHFEHDEQPSGNEHVTPRILVVDDDEILRDVLVLYLKHEGYEADAAAGGPEALAAIAERMPDLILLDLIMPGMNGYEVLEQIQTLYPRHDLPVVVVTGQNETREHVNALERGAVDFLEKPINFSVLSARVNSHIRNRPATNDIVSLEADAATQRRNRPPTREDYELRYRLIMAHMPVLMHSTDRDGIIRDVSAFWLRTLGYQRSDVLDKPSSSFLVRKITPAQSLWPRESTKIDIRAHDGRIVSGLLSGVVEYDDEREISRIHEFIRLDD